MFGPPAPVSTSRVATAMATHRSCCPPPPDHTNFFFQGMVVQPTSPARCHRGRGYPPRIIGRILRLFQVPAELRLQTTLPPSAHHPGAPSRGPPHYRRGATLPVKSQVGSGYHGSPSHGSERLPREGGLYLITHLLHILLLPRLTSPWP